MAESPAGVQYVSHVLCIWWHYEATASVASLDHLVECLVEC